MDCNENKVILMALSCAIISRKNTSQQHGITFHSTNLQNFSACATQQQQQNKKNFSIFFSLFCYEKNFAF